MVARRDLLRALIRDDDVISADMRALLDEYAGSRRRWDVTLDSGKVTISGAFADDAERSVVTALARTVAGVTSVDLRQTTGISLAWND